MVLEDTVIVSEEDYRKLYQREDYADKAVAMLRNMDLMPLTAQSLTIPRGKALLALATWVYFSGYISREYLPAVGNKPHILNKLDKKVFSALGKKFKLNSKETELKLTEDSRIIGRHLYAMGLHIPDARSTRGNGKAQKKLEYCYPKGLPHYFYDILNIHPQRNPDRKKLLLDIVHIFFADRFDMKDVPVTSRPYFDLECHLDEKAAKKYGNELIEFLNKVIPDRDNGGLFSPNKLRIFPYAHIDGGVMCKIGMSNAQFGALAVKNRPSLLDVFAPY